MERQSTEQRGLDALGPSLSLQDGVVSRRQALELGLDDNDLRRLVRRNELRAVHPGVYVDHTGELSWLQRAWAAVLHAWPAALSHHSALRAANGPGRKTSLGTTPGDPAVAPAHVFGSAPIHVAISTKRRVAVVDGVVLHRMAGLDSKAQWNRSPPRLRIEEVALDLAAEAPRELDAIAVLSDVVSSRQTTVPRLLEALARRKRIARRDFIHDVLTDVAEGTCSVLEHGYLTRVERPHGLPVGVRQAPDFSRGPLYRDVLYAALGQIVELDGRIFHSGVRRRDEDLDRDLDAAIAHKDTVRLGWGQVFDRPCWTAARIGTLLRARGWAGEPTTCQDCPTSAEGNVQPLRGSRPGRQAREGRAARSTPERVRPTPEEGGGAPQGGRSQAPGA